MQKEFPQAKLAEWSLNFTSNETLPFITKSGLIELAELEKFIATIKAQQADCVRIYFIRFQPNETPTGKVLLGGELAEGCKWFETGSGLTQATIAMVPAKHFKLDEKLIFSAEDIGIGSDITTLMPGIEDKGTGLNPPPKSL